MGHNLRTIFGCTAGEEVYESIDTYGKLKEELDSIKADIHTISTMEISEEAKSLPLEELQKQIKDVKERMHKCIDKL